MSNFIDNTVNQRFRLVYDQLKEEGKIKSKSDIASQLGTYNHVVNSILKGKRNITLDQMNKLIDIYGVNANFLFGGSNQMFDGYEDMHIPFPIVVFESNTVCLVKIKSIHGYQGVGISKGGLCIFHTMKDSTPNTKRKIVNMWWKEIDTVLILGESMTVHQRTH